MCYDKWEIWSQFYKPTNLTCLTCHVNKPLMDLTFQKKAYFQFSVLAGVVKESTTIGTTKFSFAEFKDWKPWGVGELE